MKLLNKILMYSFFTLLFLIPLNVNAENDVNLYLFYSDTCPHCAVEKEFLKEMEEKYENLNIHMYEVSDEANYTLLSKVKTLFGNDKPYVPFTVIGTLYYEGYNDNTALKIEETIEYYSVNEARNVVSELINNEIDENTEIVIDDIDSKTFNIPFIGQVTTKDISIPLVAVIIGAVDGFNPCAMWVLLFLLSMLIGNHDKKRMWLLGLTFILTSGIIYLLFMVAWLKISLSIMSINYIKFIIALIALIGGSFNLYSFYKSLQKDSGCDVVNDSKRKRIFAEIKRFTSEKSLLLAMAGVVTLAISVNFIELACSAGLPLLFTQILSLNNLSSLEYFIYILMYIIFFLLDDIIVFVIAMITFELTGISTKLNKYSHLIGGVIMVIIGLLLIFKPAWLSFNF
ncbi:MAG: hypothetical protein PHE54_02535 [Bacilli bacterium]|nr:hypothetical protein [Bacilli bacterium]